MTERNCLTLEMICKMLASVEKRLQRLEGVLEPFFDLERSVNSLQIEWNTLSEKSRIIIEEKTNEFEKAMEFENAEIDGQKIEDKIKKLEDILLYQEVYNRRENLRFFGIPESTTGV